MLLNSLNLDNTPSNYCNNFNLLTTLFPYYYPIKFYAKLLQLANSITNLLPIY